MLRYYIMLTSNCVDIFFPVVGNEKPLHPRSLTSSLLPPLPHPVALSPPLSPSPFPSSTVRPTHGHRDTGAQFLKHTIHKPGEFVQRVRNTATSYVSRTELTLWSLTGVYSRLSRRILQILKLNTSWCSNTSPQPSSDVMDGRTSSWETSSVLITAIIWKNINLLRKSAIKTTNRPASGTKMQMSR